MMHPSQQPAFQRFVATALLAATCAVLCGCSTPTILKLSGTPGAGFTGHYRAGTASMDVSGAVPMVIEVPSESLQGCEFRKSDAKDTLVLEIRRGKRSILRAPAGPGALGIRAQGDGGWNFQILR